MPLRSEHPDPSPSSERSSFGGRDRKPSSRSRQGGYPSRGRKPAEPKLGADGEPIEPKPKSTRDPKAVMFSSALRSASSKDWPAQALMDRLVEKFSDWPDAKELAEITVARLVEMKAVDDVRYARGFIRQRASRKSVKTLLRELSMKKISEADCRAALDELVERGEIQDDNASMIALWRRKFGALPVGEKEKARQARYLASRGFAPGAIYSLWRDIAKGDIPLEEE